MPAEAALGRMFPTIACPVAPGDVLEFWQRTLHGAPGNTLQTRRRGVAIVFFGTANGRGSADRHLSHLDFALGSHESS